MQDELTEHRTRPVRHHQGRIQPRNRTAWTLALAFGLIVLISLVGMAFLMASGRVGPVLAVVLKTTRGRADPAPVEYFNSGLENWLSATVHSTGTPVRFGSGEWSCGANGAEPGALRLWRESFDLANYDVAFHGRINVRSIGWAFRAADASTFYGMKITIASPGPGAISHLEHFVRIGGQEMSRESTPLPLMIEEGSEFYVQVRVRGSRFVTSIDGQRVDMWSDQRLTSGGIGFFSEAGESATIRFVRLIERGSLAGRLAGLFSLLTPEVLRLQ
jgi:hypothetical protein